MPPTWCGVTCGADGNVTGLDLEGNSVVGVVPTEVGTLSGLESLALGRRRDGSTGNACAGDDAISGTLPSEVGQLVSLTSLSLQCRYPR